MTKTVIFIFCALFAAWLMVNTGGKDSKGNMPQTTNLDNVRVMKSVNGELVVTNPGKDNPSPEYELDLTERCKDWIYFRNLAYKLGKEGDKAGAAKASLTMQTFMKDLEKQFPSHMITEEIERLEMEQSK